MNVSFLDSQRCAAAKGSHHQMEVDAFEIFSAELLPLRKLLRVKLGRDLCRSLSSAAMHAAAGAHTRLHVLTIKKTHTGTIHEPHREDKGH